MANTKYSDLLTEVLPYLSADPSDPVTENAIKHAVIELCDGSWIWRVFADPLDIVAGEAHYDLEPPSGSDVSSVLNVVAYGQDNILPKSVDWLHGNIPGWQTTPGTVRYFTQLDSEQIILAPLPDTTAVQGLTMFLALAPSLTSTSFPKWIATQYLYPIVQGALGRLMLMPNKPWTDLKSGMSHREGFSSAIANARATSVFALGSAPQRTTSQH